ncbi:hypothetical protein H8K35_10265 [Undibacterium sp. LX40W]|uniref:Uncharacterized protein n=1 Tax=Undibacterium nitidum TaxID=2762298 RepID=A0A923HSY1_9BURK|nr:MULTISPECIES: hypothetical protein [Undibacterium]MBC3881962.1 hypothetical protein [Undibacterium nitidum]MBC3892042.1 hypothetical protein [Undibacterium sp. LX40W]
MSISKAAVLTMLGPLAMTAIAQTTLPAFTPVVDYKNPLVMQFKDCVNAVGLTQDLPLVEGKPTILEKGSFFQLNETGRIRDGYRHTLYVSPDQKTIYIIQVGGFAGTQKVFGPLDRNMKCSVKTSAE